MSVCWSYTNNIIIHKFVRTSVQSIKQLKDYELQSTDSLSNKSIAETEVHKYEYWLNTGIIIFCGDGKYKCLLRISNKTNLVFFFRPGST